MASPIPIHRQSTLTPSVIATVTALYDELEKQAKDEEIAGVGVKVFRGNMIDAFTAVCNSRSQYTAAYAALELGNYITIVQKGGGKRQTMIVLNGRPPEAALQSMPSEGLTGSPRGAIVVLDAKVSAILQSLGGLNVVRALAEQSLAIQKLEQRIKQLEQKQ